MDFKYKKFYFTCPKCKRKNKIELSYLIAQPNLIIEKTWWCSNCNSNLQLKYKIEINNKDIEVKAIDFLCNDRRHNKNFRLLAL